MARHFRVTIDNKTGKATNVVLVGADEETDVGDNGSVTHHLVLAEGIERATAAAQESQKQGKQPTYPTRKKASEVTAAAV